MVVGPIRGARTTIPRLERASTVGQQLDTQTGEPVKCKDLLCELSLERGNVPSHPAVCAVVLSDLDRPRLEENSVL